MRCWLEARADGPPSFATVAARAPRAWSPRAILAACVMLALAACGPSGDGDHPGPTATLAPTPAPTDTSAPPPTETPPPRLLVLAWTDQGAFTATRFLLSDDLGATWRALEPFGPFAPTLAFAFADRQRGVVLGRTLVRRTSDGGRTWTTQLDTGAESGNEGFALEDVTIDATGAAVVFGSSGDPDDPRTFRYATWRLPADGAAAERSDVGVTGKAPIFSACLSADGVGVATGARVEIGMPSIPYQTVLVTEDGAGSWALAPQVVGGVAVLWGASACTGMDLWLAGAALDRRPRITHSSDGGATWAEPAGFDGIEHGALDAVAFVDERTGWAVGNGEFPPNPFVVSTSDRGTHWTLQSLSAITDAHLDAVAFLDRRLGVIGGATGGAVAVLLLTDDGGTTWQSRDLPAGVRDVFAAVIVR